MASKASFRRSYFSIILLLIVHSFINSPRYASADTLQLVQIVFRHGDRSPTNVVPNDPNNEYWTEVTDGFGMLTNTGKQQHYKLGQYIGQRYAGFLNKSYGHEEILINSTTKDRTLMSAYSNLAGLYPPEGNQIWDPSIPWQPIPVHTRPLLSDYILSTDADCPKYSNYFKLVKESPELQQINKDNAQLFELAHNETGLVVNDIFQLNEITDYYYCSMCHNLTIPTWIPPVWDQMMHLHDLKFYYEYGIPPLARLMGGPLVGHMIDMMTLSVNGLSPERKAYLYSSHDSKLSAFLSAMNVFNNQTPPYASAVFVELYELNAGGHGVQIWYRNDTTVDPYPLILPNCTMTCPLDQFIQLTNAMVPVDAAQECIFVSTVDKRSVFTSAIDGLRSWFTGFFSE